MKVEEVRVRSDIQNLEGKSNQVDTEMGKVMSIFSTTVNGQTGKVRGAKSGI